MQTFENLFTIWSKVRTAYRCDCSGKKARLPFLFRCLSFGSLLSLFLFNFCLQVRGLGILSPNNGVGDIFPKLERLVRQLFFKRRDNLGDRVEGSEIDDQNLLL